MIKALYHLISGTLGRLISPPSKKYIPLNPEPKRRHPYSSPKKVHPANKDVSDSDSTPKKAEPEWVDRPGTLKFEVKKINKNKTEFYEYRVRGEIPHQYPNEKLQFKVSIIQIRDDQRKTISTSQIELKGDQLNSGFEDWFNIGGVSRSELGFLGQGEMEIIAELKITPEPNPASDEKQSVCYAYMKQSLVRQKLVKQTKKSDIPSDLQQKMYLLGLSMCMAGHKYPRWDSALDWIQDWMNTYFKDIPKSKKEPYQKKLESTFRKCQDLGQKGKLQEKADQYMRMFNTLADHKTKKEASKLLIYVMTADCLPNDAQNNLLEEYRLKMGLGFKRLNKLLEQRINYVTDLRDRNLSITDEIGLEIDMDKSAIHQQLNKGFKQWNGRQSHSESSVQRQANEMLEQIARLRKRYLG
jgi:hypothetical protein